MNIDQIALVALCLMLGGLLKGATGAGAPLIAVPAMAAMFNVHVAIVVMVMPNLLTNLWQAWQCRRDRLEDAFILPFALGGGAGAAVGTVLLAWLPAGVLSFMVAMAVLFYICLRLVRRDWVLGQRLATRMAAPIGLLGGMLQGAVGLSAPVSLSFLNAMRLERRTFMATISVFFTVMTLVQIGALFVSGLLEVQLLLFSVAALVPILCAMPVGAFLARRLSRAVFDRTMLALLFVLSLKLFADALMSL